MLDDVVKLAHNPPIPGDSFLSKLLEDYKHPLTGATACTNCYRFIYGLIMLHRPMLSLELGTQYGFASAHMASAALTYGGHVIGIDINFHHIPGWLIDAEYGNYDLILGNTLAVPTILRVKDFVEKYGPIGVVYQDSSHHYTESMHEWETYAPMMSKGAIWICDDVLPAFHDPNVDPPGKSMVTYFEGLPGEKMLFPDILHKGNTVGVVLL